MLKVKRSSLLYLSIPLLFSGCIKEKISRVKPSFSTKKQVIYSKNKISITDNTNNKSSIDIEDDLLNYTPPKIQQNYTLSKIVITASYPKRNSNQLIPLDRVTFNISKPIEEDIETIEDREYIGEDRDFIEIEEEREVEDENQEYISKNSTLLEELVANMRKNKNKPIIDDSRLITKALDTNNHWQMLNKEEELIETAKEFLGVKYIWAANGPNAFDCSGFTKYVFKQHGLSLPRYSGYQAKIGTKIDYDELKKGDLVFFDTAKHKNSTSKRKVNHVGIYVGNHKFIHASSAGKQVMITSFDQKKFYKEKFLYARRVLDSTETLALLNK